MKNNRKEFEHCPNHLEQWDRNHHMALIEFAIDMGYTTGEEASRAVLESISPPYCLTNVMGRAGGALRKRYGKGKVFGVLKEWYYKQDGKCAQCGTRLHLSLDHIVPARLGEHTQDVNNWALVCSWCNAKRRKYHKKQNKNRWSPRYTGMWVLMSKKPADRTEFIKHCRMMGIAPNSDALLDQIWAFHEWNKNQGVPN